MKWATSEKIDLDGRMIDYRLVRSNTARKLRVRVGINGVEVIQPTGRETRELEAFLKSNREWIVKHLERADRLRLVRRSTPGRSREILFRGTPTPIIVEDLVQHKGPNRVIFENGVLTVLRNPNSRTLPAKSLENWLRTQARKEIHNHLDRLTSKLRKYPRKIYVMGQRTKWGNCSSLQNISFNWRLIMAPDPVMRYLITHETVHLEVPDHSKRFWLTVQSLCPETERARQWLSANSYRLMTDLCNVMPT